MDVIPLLQSIPEKIVVYGILIYLIISRLLPFLLAKFIEYKYKCSIRIERVGLPISLHQLSLKTAEFSVHIDRIGFTSSLVNSDAPKLLSVVVTCIKIVKVTNDKTTTYSGSRFPTNGERKKVTAPPMISNLVQFLGIQISEIRLWDWRSIDGTRCLHCPIFIENVCIDGCTTVGGAQISACIVISFQRCRVRLCESWNPNDHDLVDPTFGPLFFGTEGITIFEFDFDFRLNLIFSPKNSGEFIDHLSVDVEKLIVWWELKASVFNSLQKVMQKKDDRIIEELTRLEAEPDVGSWIDIVEHVIFTQLVPKDIKFRIFETECNITVDERKTDMDSKVSGFSFSSRCNVVTANEEELVSFESQLDLGLIRIEPDHHQSFSLDQFSNYIKLANNNLTVDIDFSNFALRSFERSLQFTKTRFMSNLELVQQFPKGQLVLNQIFKSIEKMTLESLGFDLTYNNKTLNFSSTVLQAHCHELDRILTGSNLAMEVVVKHFTTGLACVEEGQEITYRPVSFEIFGFDLQRQQLSAKLSGSRLEWVPQLEILITSLTTFIGGRDSSSAKKSKKQRKLKKLEFIKGFNIDMFDSRIIFMDDNNLCLNADIGSFLLESDSKSKSLTIVGFEAFSSSTFSDCTLNPVFTIPKCTVKGHMAKDVNNWYWHIDPNAVLYWSPLIHKQLMEFTNKTQQMLPKLGLKGGRHKKSTPIRTNFRFNFEKSFSLVGKLAKNHAFHFKGYDWKLEVGTGHFSLLGTEFSMHFDEHHIAQFDGFQLSRTDETLVETLTFRKIAALSQEKNQVWLADIAKLSLTFPYGYNFASAFNDEFITCFKWLKTLKSKSASDPNALWSDVVIKIGAVRIEVGDDPFEVKLRDNYELMEDEYFESLKRQTVLETKITQLCKNNPLMSSSKFDELRKQLLEKTASVYVQRSKQLYKNHPIRTHLLLWEFDSVLIVAMADPTMTGTDIVKNIIRGLDADSPLPSDGLEFSTLWCRAIRFEVGKSKVQLRDFPQPLMDAKEIYYWGKLGAAEAEANKRSRRSCEVEIGGPFGSDFIERSLNGLKWYYNLDCETKSLSLAFGPCWEPVLAQCNLSLENIFPPSKDPSRPLPFWDKIRQIFHGEVCMLVESLAFFLHASLNPYNTTEEMEVTWTGAGIAWTNGKIVFDGDLDVYVRTASKYDDCRMIRMPNVRLTFELHWVCLADSNDHHAVQLCAPDRLPEYSSNQEHDSYRAFRSQYLNMNVNLETKKVKPTSNKPPSPMALIYGSTLRWAENLKLILSGTTRPTRRGILFKNVRPRKIPISRHYKKVRLSISLHRFHVSYWISFAWQSGVELVCGTFSSSSEHMLTLQPVTDGLIHRPKADWSFVYVNSAVNDIEIWLQSSPENLGDVANRPIEKLFFMSIDRLSYVREALLLVSQEAVETTKTENPQHRLVVHELKGAWTSSNRDIAFALLDSYVKVQQLKKNLSTDALRSFFSKHDGSSSPRKNKPGSDAAKDARNTEVSPSSGQAPRPQIGASPLSSLLEPSAAVSMLQKLVAEKDSNAVAFSEDQSAPVPQQKLHGLVQCNQDDVIHQKWLIELVNCQVLLKGCETKGYVIVCSSKAHVLQRENKPVWNHGTIVPKTTWVGTLEGMQYYATVSPGNTENIQWVEVANIEERDTTKYSNVPEMVGSGQSVGGVVSETVGESSDSTDLYIQLQRIISRCKCEFFYTSYGETGVDKIPSGIPDIPPAPSDFQLWDQSNKPVEAFTLMHHDLEVFTNSLQYAMIMDVINNLVLYVDPKRKQTFEKLQRLRFKLQLQSTEAQRRPIQQLQNHLRSLVNQLRRLEKETYALHKSQLEEPDNEALHIEGDNLEQQVNECKEQVAAKGEELHMMIMCYKEAKLAASQRLSRMREKENNPTLVRVYEICFKQAQWRLTQTDGQLGIADLALSNFVYTKSDLSDNSTDHLSELGYITVTNLLPNQVYKEVLVPSHIDASMPLDRRGTLRVFCRDKPPVNGIAVKEHFEINISPITIGITYQFFKTLFKFCFPEKDPEKLDEVDVSGAPALEGADSSSLGGNLNSSTGTLDSQQSRTNTLASTSKPKKRKKKESKFYVSVGEKDDVEKMKERAEKNMLFINIKIPDVPVRVSYKGEKEKNIFDVHDAHLLIPLLEFHNITWTWLDLLVAVRNHSKRVLLSQAIKQKLQIWPKTWPDNDAGPQEEDKAKMLLGHVIEVKGLKKSLFGSKK